MKDAFKQASDEETIGHSITMEEDVSHRPQVTWTPRTSCKPAQQVGTTVDVRGRCSLIRGQAQGQNPTFSKP
jgi:hypothetical protein